MGSEWPQVRLGDYVDSILGKMLDKNKNRGDLYPYLGNKNVRWGSVELDELAEMRFEEHEHDRYGLQYGDLIVCEGGEPGRCCIWRDQVPNMKIQKALHRIRVREELSGEYLYYWFLLAGRHGWLESHFTGTTIKHLTGRSLADLSIPLPPMEIQESIGCLLGLLDNKIQLNRQINQTLEAMAQALFKSWFVDFDPVIDNALAAGNAIPDALAARAEQRRAVLAAAQAAGSTPAADDAVPALLPESTRALFPDAFVFDAEMGWVPEGWDVGPLSRIAILQNRAAHPAKEPEKCWVHFSIPAFDVNGEPALNFGSEIKSGKYFVPPSSVLASKLNPETPRIWMPKVEDPESCVCSTEFMPFVPLKLTQQAFLFAYLCSEEAQTAICNRATGSTGSRQRVKPKDIAELLLLLPSAQLMDEFSKIASEMYKKVQTGKDNNGILVNIRDVLLPKLISGELRLSDDQ